MLENRIKKIRKKLVEENIDSVLISSIANIIYLTNYSNFSKDEREAYLLIGKDFQYLITDGRYTEAVKKIVSHFTLFERGGDKKTSDLFESINSKNKALGIEEDNLTVSEYKIINKYFKKIKHSEINNVRSIKERDEIEKIKKASKLGDYAFEYILKKIKVGVSEKQIAQELEKFIKEKDAQMSFPAIVAFGKNSSIPHHQTGDTRLIKKEGQFILLDFGVKFENYCSDMTRTVFFGNPSREQKEIYGVVLQAQKEASELLRRKLKLGKKVIASEVDKIARDYIISKGYPSIPHSLGHGIGLEVHEHPYLSVKSKEELKEGMVFSIEPGIYIEEFGGVRIEDLYLLEKNELKQITNSSKELTII